MHKYLFIYLFFFFCISSCGELKETPEPEVQNEYLTSSSYIDLLNKNTLALLATQIGFGDLTDLIKYDVKVYTIEYNVKLGDSSITASGVIAIPIQKNEEFSLLVANHGTITSHNEAPSKNPTNTELVLMAGTGYYTFIPDYIGFGSSEGLVHPYYIYDYTSKTIQDGLYAAQEFARAKRIKLNGKNLIFGYSEGGYTTMSAVKNIENLGDIKIAASALGAGGYDIEAVMDVIVKEDTYSSPAYLSFIIYAYYTYYDWDIELSDFFQSPYNNTIPSLFDGTNSLDEINSHLTTVLADLLNEDFLNGMKNKTDTLLLPAFRDNSVHNWVPKNPMQMYHGTNDVIVPFSDSQTTYQNMLLNNAKNVEFYPIPGKGHGSSLPEMIKAVIPWFEAFNVDF